MIKERLSEVDWNPSLRERRKFGLTLAAGFPVMATALLLLVRFFSGDWRPDIPIAIVAIGCPLGLILAAVPAIATPFYRIWFFLICVIDTTITVILFTLVFFLVFLPAGLIIRLFGRSGIQKGFDPEASTYWRPAEQPAEPRRYFRQF